MQTINWKTGTGFDLFVSLAVLHQPATFGLRPSWAAGVRQRMYPPHQALLEKIQSFTQFPLGWLANFKGSPDAEDILQAISDIPAIDRLQDTVLIPSDRYSWASDFLLPKEALSPLSANTQAYLYLNVTGRSQIPILYYLISLSTDLPAVMS